MPPPASGQTYKCYINNKERPTVVMANGTVKCSTPMERDLPRITSDTGDVPVDLSLFSSETSIMFLSTKIPFYDCTLMKRCVLCSESNYDCDWCIYEGKCYADGSARCPGEIILSSKKRTAGAVGCPRIVENQSFLLPNTIPTSMKIKAKNLPPSKHNFKYECNVKVEGKNYRIAALRVSNSQVTCQAYSYSYTKPSQYLSAELKVLWRGTDEIYNSDSVQVSLYKCDVGRGDCSTCLVAEAKLNCGWCKQSSSCHMQKACAQKWVPRSQPCYTKPVIKETPVVKDFNPKKGPESGGTLVNITGIKLNTGRRIMAWLGDTACVVNRSEVTDTSIPCVTSFVASRTRRAVSNESTSHDVVVSFDGFRPPSPPGKFEFTADPVFISIDPDRTFPSGGLKLTITGKNFDRVRVPKIFFKKAGDEKSVSKKEICDVISSTSMICPSPNVSIFDIKPGSKNGSEVIVGLVMDNVPGLENVTTLAIIVDPYFTPFDGVKEINSESLILEGTNLDILSKKDVTVKVEGVHCNVTVLGEKQLVCTVPKEESLPEVENNEYTVIVKAGFLTFDLGKLKYFASVKESRFPMLYIYIGVSAGAFILLLVIICLCCAYRRKKRQQSKGKYKGR